MLSMGQDIGNDVQDNSKFKMKMGQRWVIVIIKVSA